jgi:hypothetical protein
LKERDIRRKVNGEKNKAGGYTYYGESCGDVGRIWDDCLGTKEEFIAVAEDCYGLKLNREKEEWLKIIKEN